MHTRMRRLAGVLAVLLSVALAACAAPPGGRQAVSGGSGTGEEPSETAFESAAQAVVPVVVTVSIQQTFPSAMGSQTVPVGNGSGIVIRPDGYILTNDHVVAGSSGIVVGLGRTRMPAKVVGEDPSTDLAVVKIDRTGLTTATIGDPKQLERGRWVIAVGSPYDLPRTVTTGIVSALDRSTVDVSGTVTTPYTNMIQTDAAINPGNSGGALATLDGKVVGVTALAESPTGASAGIGLAIPIDFAMGIADQLIRTGHAVHPYIGAAVMDVDAHIAAFLGIAGVSDGALIEQVDTGSPAAKAGLRQGDVISSVGGLPVVDAATFYAALRQQPIGSRIPLVVIRNGKALTLQVSVAAGEQG